ncbi:MAG: hypothetical protein JW833_15295 [Prolixibacteraceae bacterium]|nr:hypothetical protein [Prolixibacteraceae bacterium]
MDEFRIGDDHLARSGKGFYFNGHDSIYHDIELKYNCGFLTFLKYYYLGEQSGWIYYSYETDSENVLSRDYENNSADWSLYYFSYNNIKNLIDIMTFRPKVLGKISTNLVSEMERFDKSTQYETDKPTVTTFDYTLNDDGYVVEMKYEELDYNGIYKRNYILTKQTIYFNYEFL